MNKGNQMRLLRQAAIMFATRRVCNERSIIEWLKIVFAAHKRGYLYCGFKGDGIDLACIAYRVAEIPKVGHAAPQEEHGQILYIPAIVSNSKDSRKLLRLLRWYLKENEILQIAYRVRNTDQLRTHTIRRSHGRQFQT